MVLFLLLFISGCGFLNPVQKKDSSGNVVLDSSGKPEIVAAGTKYLETAQNAAQAASAIPIYGGVAALVASLLGFAIKVSNTAAKRNELLLATGGAIKEFIDKNPSEVGDKLKSLLSAAHSIVPVNAKKELGLS